MRNRAQWILWRFAERDGKKIKIPCMPNGAADVMNPHHRMTFSDAVNNVGWSFAGIGFVLTEDDPYVVIDYDEECPQEVINEFDTYTERSQSGRGVHIIMTGDFDGKKRKGKVECYKDKRYIIMTGDVVHDRPIRNCQQQLNKWRSYVGLVEEEKPARVHTVIRNDDSSLDDILERMYRSAKGDYMRELYECGHPAGSDKSQVDAQLLESLRFFSGGNKDKSFALFELSACCRSKWTDRRDYADRTWNHINHGPVWEPDIICDDTIDVPDNFCDKGTSTVEGDTPPPFPDEPSIPENLWVDVDMPDLLKTELQNNNLGMISKIMSTYCNTAPALMRGFAMHTALACVGTILARRFATESGNFTSLYWAIVGPSGCGKGHSISVIDRILSELGPGLEGRYSGGGYTSEGAIYSALQKEPAHLAYLDELGDYIANSRGGSNSVSSSQWRTLKELWCKNGAVKPRNYSDHSGGNKQSDAQKKCFAPCVTIFGASTMDQFWGSLNTTDSADGFLNRWLVYTDSGKPEPNLDFKHIYSWRPDAEMVEWHEEIERRSPTAILCGDGYIPNVVDPASPPEPVILRWGNGAKTVFSEYTQMIYADLWDTPEFIMFSRACQMAMNISLIVELAKNPNAKEITSDSALWAMEYVHVTISQMVKHMRRNLAGSDEERLANTLLNEIRKAHKNGMTVAQMYKKKLANGSRRNISDALTRLEESSLIESRSVSIGRGRPAKTWFAIEN